MQPAFAISRMPGAFRSDAVYPAGQGDHPPFPTGFIPGFIAGATGNPTYLLATAVGRQAAQPSFGTQGVSVMTPVGQTPDQTSPPAPSVSPPAPDTTGASATDLAGLGMSMMSGVTGNPIPLATDVMGNGFDALGNPLPPSGISGAVIVGGVAAVAVVGLLAYLVLRKK